MPGVRRSQAARIAYGYPTFEMFEASERGELAPRRESTASRPRLASSAATSSSGRLRGSKSQASAHPYAAKMSWPHAAGQEAQIDTVYTTRLDVSHWIDNH